MLECANYRIRRQPAHCAEGTIDHQFTQVVEECDVLIAILPCNDFVDDFDSTSGADAAGSTFSAALECAEFHGEACLAGEVRGVIEDLYAAVAEHTFERCEGFVVERGVEE